MAKKKPEKDEEKTEESVRNKPLSLHGHTVDEVVDRLLNTKPKPKKKEPEEDDSDTQE